MHCSRRSFLRTSSLGAAAAALPRWSQGEDIQKKGDASAHDIGSSRQLFIDDLLLDGERMDHVRRTLNGPHRIDRVLTPDQPWEALGFIFYAVVLDDGGVAKLYHGSYDADKKRYFSVATSTDGLHWERPQLGLRSYAGSTANNLLPISAVEAAIFIDPHSPPEKRYRMVYNRGFPNPDTAGVCVASSSDGLHWKEYPGRCLPFIPDSQPAAFWDERIKKYVIYLRTWNPIRAVARVEVDDLETAWPYDASVPPFHVWGKDKIPTLSRELPTVMAHDEEDPEALQYYTSEAMPYPFAPDWYFAFPAMYQNYAGPAWKGRALNTNDGTFDIDFSTSRDGIAWNRRREPYIPTGMYEGLNLRLVSMGSGMIRRGPWLRQYFIGWPYTHGLPSAWETNAASRAELLHKEHGAIYCATQRLDGFISMDAPSTGGTLVTAPLHFSGDRLRLNIHVAGSGGARVALLDAKGKAIPGFAVEDCEVIQDDAIDYEVRWQNGPNVSALAGKTVRVQFEMRSTKLYAMQFVQGAAS